ncbi:hypothetical protein ANOM_004281, partial [Aspergillus nomiae NRRL 13137]
MEFCANDIVAAVFTVDRLGVISAMPWFSVQDAVLPTIATKSASATIGRSTSPAALTLRSAGWLTSRGNLSSWQFRSSLELS